MSTAVVIVVAIAALVVAYALGTSRDAPRLDRSRRRRPPRGGESLPAAKDVPAEEPSAATGTAAFWQLIADTRQEAGNDTGRQSELLEERLSRLPAQQIVDFARMRRGLDERLYSWDIWGAAYVIEDGCSDDCFRDFRAYVISLGRGPYEAALRDPDSLAAVAQDAEEGDWENADDVAPDAYQSATGEDFPVDDSDLSGDSARRALGRRGRGRPRAALSATGGALLMSLWRRARARVSRAARALGARGALAGALFILVVVAVVLLAPKSGQRPGRLGEAPGPNPTLDRLHRAPQRGVASRAARGCRP